MATYRIGPADFFTGADLKADAVTLNQQVQALQAVYEADPANDPRISADLDQTWVSFMAVWDPYFQNTYATSGGFDNFLTALNDGNRDQLIQFENRFADIYSQFKAIGLTSIAVDVVASVGAPDTVTHLVAEIDAAAKKLLPFGLGLGAFLVIAVVVWYFLPVLMAKRG